MNRKNGSTNRSAPTYSELENQLQVLSAITNRIALSSRMGFSHGGERDLFSTLGYPKEVSSNDLISRWKRQDIARAIIDRPVQATWRGDIGVVESTEEDETELEKAYKILDNDLGLKRLFMRVDRLAQLGKYAVILLGYDDSSPETWSMPVTSGDRQLRYVRVVSEKNAEISTWEQDNSNARYGLPRLYKIKLRHPGQTTKQASLNVHHSRLIHVAPDLLENEVEAEPIMKTAYNRLMDLEKLIGGSAEMFWRGARPGYAGEAKENYKVDDDVKEKIQKQIEEYENDLRRIMVMEGIDLKNLAQQIADPKGHVEVQMQMISSLTGIPLRILTGSERGQLASGQDDDNWKEWLHDRRTEQSEPVIIRPFIDRMIESGVLPGVKSELEGYQISWPDLFTLGEEEKSKVGKERSDAIARYASEPMAETLVPPEAFLRYVLRMEDNDVNHILEMQKTHMGDIVREEEELEEVEDPIEEEDIEPGIN